MTMSPGRDIVTMSLGRILWVLSAGVDIVTMSAGVDIVTGGVWAGLRGGGGAAAGGLQPPALGSAGTLLAGQVRSFG